MHTGHGRLAPSKHPGLPLSSALVLPRGWRAASSRPSWRCRSHRGVTSALLCPVVWQSYLSQLLARRQQPLVMALPLTPPGGCRRRRHAAAPARQRGRPWESQCVCVCERKRGEAGSWGLGCGRCQLSSQMYTGSNRIYVVLTGKTPGPPAPWGRRHQPKRKSQRRHS